MQKGGNGCCGTCSYNEFKDTLAKGKERARKARCTLRNVTIERPTQKYCINHPHHNRGKVKEPVGPVFTATGHPHRQEVWSPAPDSPEIRSRLLGLLGKMVSPKYRMYYSPTEMVFDVVVLNHLEVLKEKNALPGILEVLSMAESEWVRPAAGMPTVTQAYVIRAALQAAAAIGEERFLHLVQHWIQTVKTLEGDRFVKDRSGLTVLRVGLEECMSAVMLARESAQQVRKQAEAPLGKAA